MKHTSRHVETNQLGVNERLGEIVTKHLSSSFLRPIAPHTKTAFDALQTTLKNKKQPVILDACCGVGDSSRQLAKRFPGHWVVGIDKSAHRLSKERAGTDPENLVLLRADLNDFYRLAAAAKWQPERHYILYPNPWPKAAHLKRRWHGAPVFPAIVKLGGRMEIRSNWKIYLEEFKIALEIAGHASTLNAFEPESYLTPFEKKYHQSDQQLWQLEAEL